MSFNFDDLLLQGKIAADNVLNNEQEIKSVLEDLERSLNTFLGFDIHLEERPEYAGGDNKLVSGILTAFNVQEKTGFNILFLTHTGAPIEIVMFKIKRSSKVYPITLEINKNRTISGNQAEFVAAVGQIISDPQFHLQLSSFKLKALNPPKIIAPPSE